MTDERIIAYLLRELPEEESERFEEECFASEEWPEEIRAAEHDLVEAYLRDELNPEQRRHFEQNYLTTEARLKRVATAAALLRHVDKSVAEETAAPEPAEPTWLNRFAAFWGDRSWAMCAGLAVGVVAVVVGGLWLARSRTTSPQSFATLTLNISTDSNRAEGAQASRVKLPPGAAGLRVRLKLPDPSAAAARYRAELMDEDGDANSLAEAGRNSESVYVEIPAARLRRGEYALMLSEVRPDGREQRVNGLYYFIVE